MGLDIIPSDIDYGHPDHKRLHARWSYSGFDDFRKRLAQALGFSLVETGLTTHEPSDTEKARASGLLDFLMHSDCDGELSAEQCAAMGPILRRVLEELWPGRDLARPAPVSWSYDRTQGLIVCDAMAHVAETGGRLLFR